MSEIITFPLPTGVNYVIPDVGDENWGQNVTDFLVAIPSGVMPTSGTFSLTGDVSFGPTFGLVSQYFKTATTIPATAGFLRLSKTDSLDWRNNANSANLALAINGSDQLTFAGTPITVGGVTSITGTTNQVIASASTGAVTLSTPQSIAPASSPTFAGLTLSAPLTVPNGGTGDSSFTAYSVLCGGTSSVNPLQSVASVGLNGQFLQSQGPGLLPTWANVAGSGTVNSGTAGHAAYYATSTNTISDGGSVNVQVGSLKTVAASLQIEIDAGAHSIILDASSPAADRIYTLPDRGTNDTFAFLGGQAQSFAGATIFTSASGVTITTVTNQLILGTTRTATLSAPTPTTASRTYTFPDQGADYSVVATEGAQVINGAKTFTAAIDMNSHLINNITNPVSAQDAATKNYVDARVSGTTNNLAKFTGSNTVGDSGITDSGTVVAIPASRLLNISNTGGTSNPTSQYFIKYLDTATGGRAYTYVALQSSTFSSATTIATIGAGSGGGAELIISGTQTSAPSNTSFCDKIIVSFLGSSATVTTLGSAVVGSPIARTYTITSAASVATLKLQMSGNGATYQTTFMMTALIQG